MTAPTSTYDSPLRLNLGAIPNDIDTPEALYKELLDVHNAIEGLIAGFNQLSDGELFEHKHQHDNLEGVTPNQHHNQAHDFFGADHTNKPATVVTTVSLTTAQGQMIVCNNTLPITITLHTLVVDDPVSVIRANTGVVTIDGNGALVQGNATQQLPLPGDAASLIATSLGWLLK